MSGYARLATIMDSMVYGTVVAPRRSPHTFLWKLEHKFLGSLHNSPATPSSKHLIVIHEGVAWRGIIWSDFSSSSVSYSKLTTLDREMSGPSAHLTVKDFDPVRAAW